MRKDMKFTRLTKENILNKENPMTNLETVKALVSKIPCPICLNSRFEANLNCDLKGPV